MTGAAAVLIVGATGAAGVLVEATVPAVSADAGTASS
jgi:hypothetical protein